MKRPLSTHELVMLFTGKWEATHDLEACVEVIEHAVLSAAPARHGPPSVPARTAYGAPLTDAGVLDLQDKARAVRAAVALRNGVSDAQLLGPSQRHQIAIARAEVVWILVVGRDWCYRDAAAAVGRLNHSSAFNLVKRIEASIAADYSLRDTLLGLVSAPVGARKAA